MPEREYDPTLQSPSERRSLLSQGLLRLRRLFVQVANITTLRTDTITERTPAAGVTIDGVLLKDSEVTTDAINEKTSEAGVTIDGLLIKDNFIEHEEIPTPANPALNFLRLFARANGSDIQLIALSSQGVECVICTLDDTGAPHTNTLTLNWIE
ncbi:hypothetical protein LCGC14_3029380 [marine sediment metagenome]|uniref:Uncharacterized protein n=2 Tax=marine sediment metagenome TaxID=412755 RepID=A0A0F8ZJ19_9ZZZZ